MSERSDQLLNLGSGAMVAAASRAVVGLYRPLLEPLNLTHPQYLALLALDHPAPQSCIRVAATLRLSAGTMTPILKRLDVLGLIRRVRNPSDDRELELSLTAEGRELLPALWNVGDEVQQIIRGDDSEVSQLKGLLQHMVATKS
ncbi:MarR family winged helix-turn-helix transcriptional regulator [Clavibacter sp. Sh2141]